MKENLKSKTGITLISLVITIIVLIILAGVTISTLLGENGLINRAVQAKEQTGIAGEKEILQLAVINKSMGNEKDITEQKNAFQSYLDELVGKNQTQTYINGESFTVHFLKSNRVYNIDEKGNIEKEDSSIVIKDSTCGSFEGNGTVEEPYIIMSIEDLIEWSNNYIIYKENNFILGKTLDFKSELSYYNSDSKQYADINKDGVIDNIFKEMQKGVGFTPISTFAGEFDGKNYEIKNIYINSSLKYVGFFSELNTKAYIKNLNISGEISSDNGQNGSCIGGIIGMGSGTIEKCTNYCNITKKLSGGNYGCGGIAGRFSGTINMCVNKGNIESVDLTAGICGTGSATIINCYNEGNIKGKKAVGIVGGGYWSPASKIFNSFNKGQINASDETIYGVSAGFFGYMENNISRLDIINCCNLNPNIVGAHLPGTHSIIGQIRKITPNCKNLFYVENGPAQTSIATPCSNEYLQSQDFIDNLNQYITSNTDNIDTKYWCKWKKGEDGYPTLDFENVWNGTNWSNEK